MSSGNVEAVVLFVSPCGYTTRSNGIRREKNRLLFTSLGTKFSDICPTWNASSIPSEFQMALKLGSSVSNPASILLDSPAHNFPSSRSSSCSPPPSLSHGILGVVTCPGTNQINTAVFPRSLSSGSNARSTFFKLPRSSGSSSSEGGPEDSKSSDQEKAPFGYTRKDVLLIGIGVTVLGVGLKYGLEFVGVDPLQAGNVVQLVLVLGLTIGWISTYLFRVSNKEMTYAQQLRDYENKVMEKRLEGLTEAELEALLEQVEEEKRRMASDKQL